MRDRETKRYMADIRRGYRNAAHVTWLYGFQFEIKVIAKLPEQGNS